MEIRDGDEISERSFKIFNAVADQERLSNTQRTFGMNGMGPGGQYFL
jgi:hypothetical protein